MIHNLSLRFSLLIICLDCNYGPELSPYDRTGEPVLKRHVKLANELFGSSISSTWRMGDSAFTTHFQYIIALKVRVAEW